MKEYSLQEVFQMPKDTIIELYPYSEDSKQIKLIEKYDNNKYLYYIDDEGSILDGVILSDWLINKAKFIKVKLPVTLEEVLNSDSKCKIEHWRINALIYDEDDGYKFKWLEEYQYLDEIIHAIGEEFNTTACKEILRNGKWYLENESEDEE